MSREQHEQICKDLHWIYLTKNADYGDSFKESLDKHGLIAAVVRMSDKLNRLDSLKDKAGQVGDEKLSDTVLDLANYAIMTAMWIEDSSRRTEQVDLFRVGEQIDYRGGLIGRDRNIEVDPPFDNNREIDTTFELSFDGEQIKHVPNIDPTIEYRGADFDGDCVSLDTDHSEWSKKANQMNLEYLDWLEKEKQRVIDPTMDYRRRPIDWPINRP